MAGVDALDDLQTELMKEGTSIRINSEERHRVRFGDNKTLDNNRNCVCTMATWWS